MNTRRLLVALSMVTLLSLLVAALVLGARGWSQAGAGWQAVGVCVVSVVTAIFMGDVVAIKLGLSPGASGFALGLLAIKLCSGLIDGSLLDAGRKWLTNGNGGKK